MRSVSSATWTSVDPVSAPPRPYLSTSSAFFSLVRDISSLKHEGASWGASGTREASTHLAGLLDVPVHLRDQFLGDAKRFSPRRRLMKATRRACP